MSSTVKSQRFKRMKSDIPNYILLAPFLILFLAFTVLPIISSVVLSLFNFDMINMPTFAAFNNYQRMFVGDKAFIVILKNTIILAVITGPLGFLLSFVLAWFLNEFKPMVRTLLGLCV